MWKSACVGIYQLLNWKMHGETLKSVGSVLCAILYPGANDNTNKC